MSRIDEMIQIMQTVNFDEKKQFLQALSQMAGQNIHNFTHDDKEALLAYIYEEVEHMLRAIPEAASYKEKDAIFECQHFLMDLLLPLAGSPDNLPVDKLERIKVLAELVVNERRIETTLDEIFEQPAITETDINRLLYWVRGCSDEYQRSKFLQGLDHYQKDFSKIDAAAKKLLTEYIASELRRLPQVNSEDAWNALELLADVCKHFADETVVEAVEALLPLRRSHINFYAMETLYSLSRNVPRDVINALAADLEYANLTHHVLKQEGKAELFPAEYATEEYLAKSDLVHWLTYPTELGKAPDEIVYLGRVKKLLKKEVFHVFKFRSDSNTLEDARKNKWLIGWSSNDGGTFSNFDEYALFEGATSGETLKNIKRRLL